MDDLGSQEDEVLVTGSAVCGHWDKLMTWKNVHLRKSREDFRRVSILERGRKVFDNNHNSEKAFEEEIQCTGELNPDLCVHILRIKAQG